MKVLVLVTDYPKDGGRVAHRFVHVRNMFYKKNGIDVTVLNFSSKDDYVYEDISVISLQTFKQNKQKYDVLISHQPNIRNHYLFFKKYGVLFPKFMLFFHGHEVLKMSKAYSEPYTYMKPAYIKVLGRDIYDTFKLYVWRKYLPKIVDKTKFVFVSQWMLDEFLKWTKIPFNVIKNNYSITYNCIGEAFEKTVFDNSISKEYDFITIRSNLDGSKYCIDFVNNLAKRNPGLSFLIIGKGKFFDINKKALNVTWENRSMNHVEIVEALQHARCALMPTRTDAQGLMMCEMASTGMPLITSDIAVCHEVFDEFANVKFIENENADVDLEVLCSELESRVPYEKNKKYFNENTSLYEIEIIRELVS